MFPLSFIPWLLMILYSSECKFDRLCGRPSLSDLETETVSHIIYFNVLNKKMPLRLLSLYIKYNFHSENYNHDTIIYQHFYPLKYNNVFYIIKNIYWNYLKIWTIQSKILNYYWYVLCIITWKHLCHIIKIAINCFDFCVRKQTLQYIGLYVVFIRLQDVENIDKMIRTATSSSKISIIENRYRKTARRKSPSVGSRRSRVQRVECFVQSDR